MFVAVSGTQTDGHAFISKAIEKGADGLIAVAAGAGGQSRRAR